MERSSNQGDVEAARDLLLRVYWNRLSRLASDQAAEQIVRAGLKGEPRLAETALIYLSRFGGRGKDAQARRTKLTAVPGIRKRILAPERIRLVAIQDPAHFWMHVETVLGESESDG